MASRSTWTSAWGTPVEGSDVTVLMWSSVAVGVSSAARLPPAHRHLNTMTESSTVAIPTRIQMPARTSVEVPTAVSKSAACGRCSERPGPVVRCASSTAAPPRATSTPPITAAQKTTVTHLPPTPQFYGIPESFLRRSEEHTSELQSRGHLVCRLLLEKKKPIHTDGY